MLALPIQIFVSILAGHRGLPGLWRNLAKLELERFHASLNSPTQPHNSRANLAARRGILQQWPRNHGRVRTELRCCSAAV
ncbi:hypothetical protein BJ170DRAFT_638747 [Xylariales sp. AK1849]|nr:hypothetical protein BJ170DRAFT_638747 [Xylariales sp. AK1849]